MRHLAGLVAAVALIGASAFAAPPTLSQTPLSWSPEQQAWGYRHMEDAFPVKVAARGDHVRALPRASRQIDPKWTRDGQPQSISSYMTAHHTSGLMVLKDGKVVLERYGLGRKPDERWTSFSVAKSITSTLVGAAIADGKIRSLDDMVSTYLPDLKGSAYDDVTIRQLITMTSGVKWNEDYGDPNSDVAQIGLFTAEPGVNPTLAYMRKLPRAHPPGSKFVYDTGETDLTGILVSTAVGKPLSEYLSEKVWKPFGMEQDALWMTDQGGHERGGCCLSMTLRDYARIGQFLLEDGMVDGQAILPRGWVADASTYHVKFGSEVEPPELGYGYFFWLMPGGYAAEGIFGQQIFIFPRDRVVIAVNSAWAEADNDKDWAAQHTMAEAVRKALR